MKIFIPTTGLRPHTTYFNLPTAIANRVEFVVGTPEGLESLNRIAREYGNPVHVVPGARIAQKRQWILDYCDGPFLMLDDDLRFFYRRDDEATKFAKAFEGQIDKMVKDIEGCLNACAHVGVTGREGANRITSRYVYTTRMMRVLGYNAEILKNEGIRFDRMEVMEDFDVNLSLLEKGYNSVCLNWMVHDQGASNAPGGCSEWRTDFVQAAGAETLRQYHPDFVTVVKKRTKTAWGGQERTDVRVQWKQAYAVGASRQAALLDGRKRQNTGGEGTGLAQALEP